MCRHRSSTSLQVVPSIPLNSANFMETLLVRWARGYHTGAMVTSAAPPSHHALAIHPGALGDVLQAVPALRALATLYGGLRVSLAAQPRLAALLAGAGVVDEALSFESLGLDNLFADAPVSAALADRLDGFHAVVSWFGGRGAPDPARPPALGPPGVP